MTHRSGCRSQGIGVSLPREVERPGLGPWSVVHMGRATDLGCLCLSVSCERGLQRAVEDPPTAPRHGTPRRHRNELVVVRVVAGGGGTRSPLTTLPHVPLLVTCWKRSPGSACSEGMFVASKLGVLCWVLCWVQGLGGQNNPGIFLAHHCRNGCFTKNPGFYSGF